MAAVHPETMAHRFAARHRARADMSCCPLRSGGHQLNGADTAPFSRGCASLAPLVGQKDDSLTVKRDTRKQILITHNQQYRERCCHHFPQVGGAAHLAPVIQLVSKDVLKMRR